jgi:hypothetical protein
MSDENPTSDKMMERVLKLLTIARESEVVEALSKCSIPYDVVTANALLNLGLHMLQHIEYPLDRLETLLLNMASKANSMSKAQNAENN